MGDSPAGSSGRTANAEYGASIRMKNGEAFQSPRGHSERQSQAYAAVDPGAPPDILSSHRTFRHDLGTQNLPPIASLSQTYPTFLRGIENHAEESHMDLLGRASDSPMTYNPPLTAHFFPGNAPPMASGYSSPTPAPSHGARIKNDQYNPFGGLFPNSESARQYRKTETRSRSGPYRPAESDVTISHIRNSRQHHVGRIYDAMIRKDAAKDNLNSIAMRRWVHGVYYDSSVIEAHAHKVLDSLLELAENGFRGWPHNDYSNDERKADDEDREASCGERFENIVKALEQEKTICEDVMNSACQIRMFVNAPRAYAQRKLNNRVGNRKRGRTKRATSELPEEPEGPRPSKMRRPNPRPPARPLIPEPCRPVLRNLAPNADSVHLGYPTPPMNFLASPTFSHPAPNNLFSSQDGQTGVTSTAPVQFMFSNPLFPPHQLHAQYHIPRMSSLPPPRQDNPSSPPPLPPLHDLPVSNLNHCLAPYFTHLNPTDEYADFAFTEPLPNQIPESAQPATAKGIFSPPEQDHTELEQSDAKADLASEFLNFWGELDGVQELNFPTFTNTENIN